MFCDFIGYQIQQMGSVNKDCATKLDKMIMVFTCSIQRSTGHSLLTLYVAKVKWPTSIFQAKSLCQISGISKNN